MTHGSHPVAKGVAGVLGGLGVGAAAGFVGSLLRRRPPTIYASGLQSSEPDKPDNIADQRDAGGSETGEPGSAPNELPVSRGRKG